MRLPTYERAGIEDADLTNHLKQSQRLDGSRLEQHACSVATSVRDHYSP